MSVRDGDRIVAACSYSKACKLGVETSSKKTKVISSKDITSGRRALKGTKIVPRGEIISVEVL